MILQYKKSNTDKRFRFRDFLQYVTVLPNFSENVYVPSAFECYLFFNPVNPNNCTGLIFMRVGKYA